MDALFGVRMTGPLAPFAPGFVVELARLGFTPCSTADQLRLTAHLSRWMDGEGLLVGGLSELSAREFVAVRCAGGYRAHRNVRSLRWLLEYLRDLGVVPAELAAQRTPGEVVLDRFEAYLLQERGLAVKVARGYVDSVRAFVEVRVGAHGVDPARVTPGEITSFMVAQSGRLAPKTLQRTASALRGLLRWWHLDGVVMTSLAGAVPKVSSRPARLPRALEPGQVAAMLASADIASVQGLRDYAILTVLARLGLRGGEVAGLQLEDLHWRAGQITVRGKGNRRDLLPLPVDVGQAVADYLRSGRPADALDRCVFIRVKAPHRGLTGVGITQVVAAAGRRAGVSGTIYAHRLRHSTGTAMLAAGAGLEEIGQVLRHRGASTTAIYAGVDITALRALARPWPGSVA